MNVLDLLFKNMNIVIIIGTALVALWAKSRRGAGQTKPSMPPFGGPPAGSEWLGRKEQTAAERSGAKPAGAGAERKDGYAAATRSAAPSGGVSAGKPGSAAAKESDRRSRQPQSAEGGLALSDAAKGVIWAEVLGEPRAKKPFRPR